MAADKRLICEAAALENGGAGIRFTAVLFGAEFPAFAIRYDGQVRAYLNRCAHVAIELDWQEGQFFDAGGDLLLCSTHGALYAPESGQCVAGPCVGRSLTSLPVVEEDGKVYLLVTNQLAT